MIEHWRKLVALVTSLAIGRHLYSSYLLTAIRHFRKNKLTTILNSIGLTLGISCFIFICLYVYNELGFDRHIKDADRIYRATMSWQSFADSDYLNLGLSLTSLPEQLPFCCPEIEAATGIAELPYGAKVQVGTNVFEEEHFFETDTSYFRVFPTQPLLGDLEHATGHSSLVLTQSLAKKYFGDTNPLQQVVMIDSVAYQVSAVIKDLPANSTIHYDALLFTLSIYSTDWCFTFFKKRPNADVRNLEDKLNDLLLDEYGSYFSAVQSKGYYHIEKLTDIHFGEAKIFDPPKGNRLMLFISVTIALLIMIISCINYVNITVAVVSTRQVETGIRRILGAHYGHTFFQNILEFFLLASICLAMSIILLSNLSSKINGLEIMHGALGIESMVLTAVCALVILLLLSILFGGYISSQAPSTPLQNLRQQGGFKGNRLFRNSLLMFQFTSSIIVIFITLVVLRQMNLITERANGTGLNQIMVIDLPTDTPSAPVEKFYHSLQELPYVKSLSFVGYRSLPTLATDYELFSINVNGLPKIQTFPYIRVDETFFSLLGIPLLAGRTFTKTDFDEKWGHPIVNEAFVKSQGWKDDPLQHRISYGGLSDEGSEIIGVVGDFGFQGFQSVPQPMIFYPNTGPREKLMIRFSSTDNMKIETVKGIWQRAMKLPIEFKFFNEYFLKVIEKEKNLQWLLSHFSVLCVLIAALGLFGIISTRLTQHRREIAIRKTFGAQLSDLMIHTYKEYVLLLLLSAGLAYPLGLIAIGLWLQKFRDKASVLFQTYTESIAVMIVVVLVALTYHSIQMSKAQYLRWMRNE